VGGGIAENLVGRNSTGYLPACPHELAEYVRCSALRDTIEQPNLNGAPGAGFERRFAFEPALLYECTLARRTLVRLVR
jgi:hypothetical protein